MLIPIKNKLCPLVKNPLVECYCFDLNSKTITPAIKYCGNNYASCDIYISEASDKKHHASTSRNK